jgi:adenine-specific DNA methylase
MTDALDRPRLIEVAFPLKQASLDSVHEKNVRHGHISTLHIWPARRPLAACRAALIATLLPDPGNAEERKEILERLAGRVVEKKRRQRQPDGQIRETTVEETEGGILHWGRESGPDLDWFRSKIREAYGGRAPRVLDPFAGGGAIPLEAMRLGCEATAIDINPVAWFILKCTLEYPQGLAGQTRPLPDFILQDREFLQQFLEDKGLKGRTLDAEVDRVVESGETGRRLPGLDAPTVSLDADLAWHVRAWGRWVLERAREELAPYYPVVDGKPTVAYLWARTVACKHCRATIPLLKTRWLCKKEHKRVVLTMKPNMDRTGVEFGVEIDVPVVGITAAQRRDNDRRQGSGTMSRSGASCPNCDHIMTMEDLRYEGQNGRLDFVMTAAVVETRLGKEYRSPTSADVEAARKAEDAVERVLASIPFGPPVEPTPRGGGSGAGRAFSVYGYGITQWRDLFMPRQLMQGRRI